MPIDATTYGQIRVETNVGGQIVDLEETTFRQDQYGRNQQREPRVARLNRQAVEASQPEVKEQPPKPRKKRRTKAEIEADKKRDRMLEEAHTKDLKNKNLR